MKWNFPSNNYGEVNGIGQAGIETFKGTPYKSLAREICQNSLDARAYADKPVMIEFSDSRLCMEEIPDFQKLKQALELCRDFWKKQKNKKTIDFFEKAVLEASKETVSVLRISDSNTIGLTGSDQDYNTPWQNLVKASGVSDKGENSGGSFGIGKSAAYACSVFRTVFYATKDENGLEASQGVARLVSFIPEISDSDQDADCITTGIGYCGEPHRNRAVSECISLDHQFKRTEAGTDVYILGFMNKKGWEYDIVSSVLDDFLIAVFYGTLLVKIGNVTISKKTLPDIVEKYRDSAPMAYNYYQTLVSGEARTIEHHFENLGDIELHVLIQCGLHRRVFMSRSNGMKVFDQKNFPSSIQFAGICILKDSGINSYFREMENPQHSAWEPERHSKPAEAKKYRQALLRFIKETVLSLGRKTAVAEIDAQGVGDFLPDDITEDAGSNRKEALSDKTKSIDLSLSEAKNIQKGWETVMKKEGSDHIDDFGEVLEEEYGDSGSKDYSNGNETGLKQGTNYGGGDGSGPGKNGDGPNRYDSGMPETNESEIVRTRYEIHTIAVRLILKDASCNRYKLIFIPEKTAGRGYLQIKLSGEQSSFDVNINSAFNCMTSEKMDVSRNKIFLSNIIKNNRMIVEFEVDYSERSSMEARLYGYKI